MKKYLYFSLCCLLSILSFVPAQKKASKMSEKEYKKFLKDKSKQALILSPFTPISLVCSCEPEYDDPTSSSGSGGHKSHHSHSSHQSHRSSR